MADIELVVKMSEEDYKKVLEINNRECEWNNMHSCYEAILNGTPLPKGHGDLIDRGKLKTHFVGTEQGTDLEVYLETTIIDAPTIIEAGKAESEE